MALTPAAKVRTSGNPGSLRDLARVGLEVMPLPRALEEGGLAREDVTALLREHLGRGPGQILSKTGALHLRGAPTLFLEMSISEETTGLFLYAVVLELVQGVSLARLSDADRMAAPTWRAQAIGLVEGSRFSSLRERIAAVADAFADASGHAEGNQ